MKLKRETPAPRFAGIGGHHCIGCGETDLDKFGLKAGKPRARCKKCTSIENGKSRDRARAENLQGWRKRHAQYGREGRARRSPERARQIERKGRLKKYGLTFEQFDAMLETQGGVCAICRSPKEEERAWHIDHDHDTGVVRGILCSNCNTGLGLFRDDASRLTQAIMYLNRSANDGK